MLGPTLVVEELDDEFVEPLAVEISHLLSSRSSGDAEASPPLNSFHFTAVHSGTIPHPAMPKTDTPHQKGHVANIQVTKSGVQYVEPGYYLDDPDVRVEIRAMGKLFNDYVVKRGRTLKLRSSGLKAKSAQRRRSLTHRLKRG